jgi:NADPH:quinone reductase-like Zn-dependent oxidoreductase
MTRAIAIRHVYFEHLGTFANDMSAKKFGARSTAQEVIRGHNLTGREVIVTGGASGIGVETVRAMALANARVVIATRDATRGEAVAAAGSMERGRQTPA